MQDILGFLIVDKKVRGRINQHEGTMEIEDTDDEESLQAMQKWSSAVTSLYQTVFKDGDGFKAPPSADMGLADDQSEMAPSVLGRVSARNTGHKRDPAFQGRGKGGVFA